MDKLIRMILVTVSCVAVQACADRPNTAAPVKPTIPSAAAATAKPASPANPAPASSNIQAVVLDDKTLTQSEVNSLLSQGYKPKKGHGDDVLYCRSEMQLGSRFPTKVCLTGEQIKSEIQDSKDTTAILERNMGNGAGACGSAKCN